MNSSGSKGALGGVASELLVIKNLRRILYLPTDQSIDEKIESIRFRLGDNFFFRREQSLPIAIAILNWIYRHHYTKTVVRIHWTGRSGVQEQLGICSRHPADIIIDFSNGERFGVSIKSSTTNSYKLNFRNRGLKSLCSEMRCEHISEQVEEDEQYYLESLDLTTRKELLDLQKTDPNVLSDSKSEGTRILQEVRRMLLNFFWNNSTEENKQLLIDNFVRFTDSDLPYIKVTGLKTVEPVVYDPNDNGLISVIRCADSLDFQQSGKYVIKVRANGQNIIDLSPKYSNQKISTGVIVIAR